MDRIAIISDIHGNVPALESVLKDIKNREIKKIICLGDLAGKGPSGAKAVDMIREHCEIVLKGNWDFFLTEQSHDMLKWHQDELGEERLEYMKGLPVYEEFYMSGKLIRLCHADPNDILHRVHITTELERRMKLFKPTPTNSRESDVVGYGDIHGAYIDNFDGKTLFNAGSVGNPLEITQASYAVLEGKYDSKEHDSFIISLIRVPYDIEEAVKQAENSSMPDIDKYVIELRTGVYQRRWKRKDKEGIKTKKYNNLRWLGNDSMCLDEIMIKNCDEVYMGCYGGNTEAGANKNEDGALILSDVNNKWKFAMILDSHTTSQSAKLVLDTIEKRKEDIVSKLELPIDTAFTELQKLILDILQSDDFKQECKEIRGETACLICVQKEQFIWWFSIGDNLVYLLHPEFAELGQFTLNQRQFYQWVGQVNSIDLAVPCYSSGIRELREGWNYIYLITDGVLECGSRPFENSKDFYDVLTKQNERKEVSIKSNIFNVLNRAHDEKGWDSATVIGWSFYNDKKACRPSR